MAVNTSRDDFYKVFPKLEEVILEAASEINLPKSEMDYFKEARLCPSTHSPTGI